MGRNLVVVTVIFVLLAACAAKVPVPQIPLLQDQPSLASAGGDAFQNLAKFEAPQAPAPLQPKHGVEMPKVGDTTSYGVVVTADLATAFSAYVRGAMRRRRSKHSKGRGWPPARMPAPCSRSPCSGPKFSS